MYSSADYSSSESRSTNSTVSIPVDVVEAANEVGGGSTPARGQHWREATLVVGGGKCGGVTLS